MSVFYGDKNINSVNLRRFGATGDGSTDDTAAIQAAVDSGKAVYVPEGTYKHGTITITDDITMSGPGIFLHTKDTGKFSIEFAWGSSSGGGAIDKIFYKDNMILSPGDVTGVVPMVHSNFYMGAGPTTLPNSATPTVSGYTDVLTGGATAITNFIGLANQTIRVMIASGHQVNNTATIVTKSGANIAGPAVRTFTKYAGVWYEN